jgi:hypothetical protein
MRQLKHSTFFPTKNFWACREKAAGYRYRCWQNIGGEAGHKRDANMKNGEGKMTESIVDIVHHPTRPDLPLRRDAGERVLVRMSTSKSSNAPIQDIDKVIGSGKLHPCHHDSTRHQIAQSIVISKGAGSQQRFG